MPARMTPSAEHPLGDVLDLLREWWAVNHAFQRASKRMQSRIGITGQQRFVVRVIGRYPGIAPGQLASVLHLDPGSITAAIHRLEEARIVERRRAVSDGRSASLVLTARGRRLDTQDPQTIEGALERLMARVPRARVEAVRAFLATFVSEMEATFTPEPKRAPPPGKGRAPRANKDGSPPNKGRSPPVRARR